MKVTSASNRYAGKTQQQASQAQEPQWDSFDEKVEKTSTNNSKIFDYLVSDSFKADVRKLYADGEASNKLKLTIAYCSKKQEGELNTTFLQDELISMAKLNVKKGVGIPVSAPAMKTSEIIRYMNDQKFIDDATEFFFDESPNKDFIKLVKNIDSKINGTADIYEGWSHDVFIKYPPTGNQKNPREVKLGDDRALIIMTLNHLGVPLDKFEEEILYKVYDKDGNEVTDKDEKNAYVRATGWAFPCEPAKEAK